MQKRYGLILGGMLLLMLTAPVATHAQFIERIRGGVEQASDPAGFSRQPLEVIVGLLINAALGLVGVVLLAFMIYAGFLWMTAGGDEEKVRKARGMIFNAIIGLVIVAISYAITDFVLARLVEVTGGGTAAG